jgi:MFS family permease
MPAIPLLDRARTIAPPTYNRWLIPPAALAIHLAIGQVYAFSVFKIPLSKLYAVAGSAARNLNDLKLVTRVTGDWSESSLQWIFSIAIVCLGLSAALWGTWLERAGPRKAMFTSACCFAGGFLIAALGAHVHQLWLLYLGYGVLGGIGLGIGYISPVSTLIKWFPDRPGMATGMAIMGFGGGAMIGGPLANALMNRYFAVSPNGVMPTFITMGIGYFLFMMFGTFLVRLPAPGWKPAGYVPPSAATRRLITTANVSASQAIRTPQFYLLWMVLFLNVTAGIGILEHASPMIQDMFPMKVTAAAAGGFVGLLSIFNMLGRFGWSSLSDYLGRKVNYAIYFALGTVLYALVPHTQRMHSVVLFVIVTAIILSMYGGGFATVPAYLKDLFGVMQVGAIHGRLLTAWSAAGVAGPALVNYIRDYQVAHGVAGGRQYDLTMYLMACLLAIGFVCNLLVRPVDPRHHYAVVTADAPQLNPPSVTSPGAAGALPARP